MDSPRWLITTLKGVYVVENFLLGWSPRLRSSPPSCRKTLRWYLHWNSGELQVTSEACSMSTYRSSPRDSLFTSAIPRNSDDAESPKAPSTYFSRTLKSTTTYSTQLLYVHESNSTYSIHLLYNPTSSGIQSPVCDKVDALTAQSVQPEGHHLPKVGG